MANYGDPCEVCGAPATTLIQDQAETEPVEVDGRKYRRTRPDGPVHAFCEAHKRPYRQQTLDAAPP